MTGRDSRSGFSLVELLIALAILGVALVAFAFAQAGALRASVGSALVTGAKAAANRVLEEKTTQVLRVMTDADPGWSDSYTDSVEPLTGTKYSFLFHDFYYRCPTSVTPTNGRTTLRTSDQLGGCSGTVDADDTAAQALDGVEDMTIDWVLLGRGGVAGEGIIDIVVTAEADTGAIVTVGTTITCYDIYPAPTKNAPAPCPAPPASGAVAGGRP